MENKIREGFRKELAVHFAEEPGKLWRVDFPEEIHEHTACDQEIAPAFTLFKVNPGVESRRTHFIHQIMKCHQACHSTWFRRRE